MADEVEEEIQYERGCWVKDGEVEWMEKVENEQGRYGREISYKHININIYTQDKGITYVPPVMGLVEPPAVQSRVKDVNTCPPPLALLKLKTMSPIPSPLTFQVQS